MLLLLHLLLTFLWPLDKLALSQCFVFTYIFRLRAHWKYHKTVQNPKIKKSTEIQCLPRIQITFQRDFLKEKSCRCCQCCQCCLCCHCCHCCHCYLCIFRIPQSIFTSSLMTVVDYTQSWSNLFSLKRWRNVDCWLGEKTKEVKTLRNAKVLTSSLSFKENCQILKSYSIIYHFIL